MLSLVEGVATKDPNSSEARREGLPPLERRARLGVAPRGVPRLLSANAGVSYDEDARGCCRRPRTPNHVTHSSQVGTGPLVAVEQPARALLAVGVTAAHAIAITRVRRNNVVITRAWHEGVVTHADVANCSSRLYAESAPPPGASGWCITMRVTVVC